MNLIVLLVVINLHCQYKIQIALVSTIEAAELQCNEDISDASKLSYEAEVVDTRRLDYWPILSSLQTSQIPSRVTGRFYDLSCLPVHGRIHCVLYLALKMHAFP